MTVPLYNLTDTWNNAGTVFDGLKLNVTNTASAAGSALMNLQVNGVNTFKIDKSGKTYITKTDDGAGNFERGFIGWTSNLFSIGSEAGGTGTVRLIDFTLDDATNATYQYSFNNSHTGSGIQTGIALLSLNSSNGADRSWALTTNFATHGDITFVVSASNSTVPAGTGALTLTATDLRAGADGASTLGISALRWSSLFLSGGAVIDVGGTLTFNGGVVGVNSSISAFDGNFVSSPFLQVVGTAFDSSSIGQARFSNTATPGRFILAKSRGVTIGDYTIVQNGDQLGDILFQGSDGTDFGVGAGIRAEVDGTPGNNDMPGRLLFLTAADGTITLTERLRIDNAGLITVAANGSLKLAAGTTTVAPFLFQAGTNLTSAADGAMEFDGLSLFFSPDASDRRILPAIAYIRQHATFTLSSSASIQKLFNGSTNGQITLPTGWYEFEGIVYITTMSATSNNAAFTIANGTGTGANFLLYWTAIDAAQPPASGGVAWQSGSTTSNATPANMATATTSTEMAFYVKGTLEVSVAGTFIPSITLGNANAAVVQIGSYMKLTRMGATTDVVLGNWS